MAGNSDDDRPTYASPPCLMHEVDPTYLGYMNTAEMIDLLNTLLEAERAGAKGVGEMSGVERDPKLAPLLQDVAKDEARYCAMLTRHIVRLGGTPNNATGAFYEKLRDAPSLERKLDLLDRGQGWVARKLREALTKIDDPMLYTDLVEMADTHDRNIAACRAFASAGLPK
jgi:nitronate monooxygenase